MKRSILISASILIASTAFAQSDATSDNSLFNFDNTGNVKEITKLGTAPEFPFLRNMSSPHQVYAAIKRNDREHTSGMKRLNNLLMQIGFTKGAKDLQESDVTEAMIAPGTEGNMGSRGYKYSYARLDGDASEFKAWKISSSTGSLYLMAKCGNAFYPKGTVNRTACITAPVKLTTDQQITLPASDQKITTDNKTYVYYERKHHKRHDAAYPIADISDKYPSRPIMISDEKDADVMPVTYNVTLSTPENTVSVCPNNTLNINANVNVERVASYTGNYPTSGDHKQYKKIKKRAYKMVARKMRRIKRKEEKIARRTKTTVDVSTTKA